MKLLKNASFLVPFSSIPLISVIFFTVDGISVCVLPSSELFLREIVFKFTSRSDHSAPLRHVVSKQVDFQVSTIRGKARIYPCIYTNDIKRWDNSGSASRYHVRGHRKHFSIFNVYPRPKFGITISERTQCLEYCLCFLPCSGSGCSVGIAVDSPRNTTGGSRCYMLAV